MELRDPLLLNIERFLAEAGMEPTTFGEKSMNDGNFVRDLRNGREVRRRTRERVLRFISAWQAEHRSEPTNGPVGVAGGRTTKQQTAA